MRQIIILCGAERPPLTEAISKVLRMENMGISIREATEAIRDFGMKAREITHNISNEMEELFRRLKREDFFQVKRNYKPWLRFKSLVRTNHDPRRFILRPWGNISKWGGIKPQAFSRQMGFCKSGHLPKRIRKIRKSK